MVYLQAQEQEDELRWIHTSHILAQQHNIHRGKQSKAVEWVDYHPYQQQRKRHTPAPEFTERDNSLFRKMANLMAHGTQRSS